jgi:hypothetical protein
MVTFEPCLRRLLVRPVVENTTLRERLARSVCRHVGGQNLGGCFGSVGSGSEVTVTAFDQTVVRGARTLEFPVSAQIATLNRGRAGRVWSSPFVGPQPGMREA